MTGASDASPEHEPPDAWDRAAAWLGRRGALPALGLLTVLAGVMYSGVFRGEIVGDDLTFHMAEARRIADCLAAGDWDFWNPSANAGYASLYYYQAVPQLASAIPAALFGHFVLWFQLSVFLPHLLAPAAAYRGARLLGATPWQAVGGALAVMMISGASRWGTGADGTFQVGLYTQTWALAAFPLALGYGARWIAAGAHLPAAIAWGAFVTLCHPFAGISLGLVLVIGVACHGLAAMAAGVAPRARRSPAQLAALAAALAAVAVHLALLILDQRVLYLAPLALVGALAARLGLDLKSGHRPARPRVRALLAAEVPRLIVLGVAMLAAALPVWLPVLVDYEGFGGFPHRVSDEVGPGYLELMRWQVGAGIMDFRRPAILTWLIPIAVFLGRGAFLRWLWMPAAAFAALLALGPHMPKTADDLLPAVRFLGAMQIVLALAVGASAIEIGARLWEAPDGSLPRRLMRVGFLAGTLAAGATLAGFLALGADDSMPIRVGQALTLRALGPDLVRVIGLLAVAAGAALLAPRAWRALASQYGIRTALSATLAALIVLVVVPGTQALGGRVRVLADYEASSRDELLALNAAVAKEPQGRRQVSTGTENHWWNLLPYVYVHRPSLLQMGGGGLQASPNYDFLWSVRDLAKLAWVYDTPYIVFARANESTQPAGEAVAETEHYALRRLRAPGLVSPIQITGALPPGRAAARQAAIEWLRTDMPYGNRHLAYDGHGPAGPPPAATVRRAGRTDSPGDHADLFAEVDAAQPSTFVFRESWHPRWRAFVDGAPAPIRRVTPDFPAVDAPAGRHLLQLRFERPWWAHAAWLAWPAAPLLAWLALRLLARRRSARPAPGDAPAAP